MFKKIAFAAVLALATSSSFAANGTRYYAGVDLGQSEIDNYNEDLTSYGAFAGYRFNENIALEGGLRRLGKKDGAKGDQVAVSAVFTGYAKGEWQHISLFARLGVNRVNFDGCGSICGEDKTTGLVGLGIGYDFTPTVTGRLEYQRPTSDTSNLSVGVAYSF